MLIRRSVQQRNTKSYFHTAFSALAVSGNANSLRPTHPQQMFSWWANSNVIFGGFYIAQSIEALRSLTTKELPICTGCNVHFLNAPTKSVSNGESTLRYEVQSIGEDHKTRQTFIVRCYEEDAANKNVLPLAVTILGAQFGGKVDPRRPTMQRERSLKDLPPPDECQSALEIYNAFLKNSQNDTNELISIAQAHVQNMAQLVEFRPMHTNFILRLQNGRAKMRFWFHYKFNNCLLANQAILAFISDAYMQSSAVQGRNVASENNERCFTPAASLSHILHFNSLRKEDYIGQGGDFSQWFLFEIDTISLDSGRAITKSQICNENGVFLLSAQQEGIIRHRS